jgi:hypothetical protein
VVLSLWKSRAAEPAPVFGDDASAMELLECVVQELIAGRGRSDIVHELVRHRWQRPAANRFCHLAQEIAGEMRQLPEQRAACARKGLERIQASYGWIGSGLIVAVMLWAGDNNLGRFAGWSLIIVGYGLIELMSGLTLWWPHKQFLPAVDQRASSDSVPPQKPK